MTEQQKQEAAFEYLKTTGIFFGRFGQDAEEDDKSERTLNMNDVWGWACSDGYEVSMEQMPELRRLHDQYGWCGVLYFVDEAEGRHGSEFHHYNRMIEFVRKEEAIRAKHDRHSAYAYDKQSYTIGE